MKMKWDAKELIEFGNRIADEHEFESKLMTITQDVARALHEALKTNTPVLTGNLRKMWSTQENLSFTVKKVGKGYEVELVNEARNTVDMGLYRSSPNSPNGYMYGTAVNDGHYSRGGGWVRGRFFVENSILDTEEKLNSLVMQELEKWIRWCMSGK